jgi:hypothetical protein
MTAYTVTGHPLAVLSVVDPQDAEALRALLQGNGVGQIVNITLTGNSDTKIKAHGALK